MFAAALTQTAVVALFLSEAHRHCWSSVCLLNVLVANGLPKSAAISFRHYGA
jgi:hypothetical protein